LKPVFQDEPHPRRGKPEDDRPDLAPLVFQSEIEMTGCGSAQVRDLAFDPYIGKIRFKGAPNKGIQFRNGQNPFR
jgi:hypothetical protein